MYFTENETTVKIGQAAATVIADSKQHGKRITTLELIYPRYIHSELMTHRCLVGDTVLTFDLPAGGHNSEYKPYALTLAEFWDKWENGSKPHKTRWGGERRYSLKGRLNKMRLRSVNESTMEVTHTTINDCWLVGEKPVYKLIAGNFNIECTADHLILTENGWKELQNIVVGEDCVYCNSRKKYLEPKADKYKKIDGQWVNKWANRVRPEVIARQNFVCADCGEKCDKFEIHHVIPKHERPDLAFDVNNVVALCTECHKARHKVQGWQGCSQCNLMPVTVEKIEYVGVKPVYDISVSSEYHNFLANGIIVHNCFSRNAASSRARPITANIKEVFENPVFFDYVGINQKGMVAGAPLAPKDLENFKNDWECLGRYVANRIQEMGQKYSIHKQTLNRALEPWLRIRTLVTATEWDNFFKLRLASDVQPEMYSLARAMYEAMKKSTPKKCTVHTPYSNDADAVTSVARCARVSYSMRDGKESTLEEDRILYTQLLTSGHMSPFEHVAYASEGHYANFEGWQSLRNIME